MGKLRSPWHFFFFFFIFLFSFFSFFVHGNIGEYLYTPSIANDDEISPLLYIIAKDETQKEVKKKNKKYTYEELMGETSCEKMKKKEIKIHIFPSPNWTPSQLLQTVDCKCGMF